MLSMHDSCSDFGFFSGFVASGPLVVLAEAVLHMGSKPSYKQQMLLFQLVAGLTLAGNLLHLVASVQSCTLHCSLRQSIATWEWVQACQQTTFAVTCYNS